MGGTSGSPLGREEGSRGTFMEWFPGRAFAFFRRAAKEGRSRRSEISLVQTPVPAATGNPPPLYVFAACLCDSFSRPVT